MTFYRDIVASMADLLLEEASSARWIGGAHHTRRGWRGLVTARRTHVGIGP